MKIFAGILIGLGIALLGCVVVAATGAFDVAAVSPPSKFEKKVADFTLRRSVARRAPRTPNPQAASPEVWRAGLAHFKENCVMCHGAPGVDESEFGQGLNPPAPDLTLPAIQKMTDGELFWIVSNGIRMTGMPAFSPTHKPEEVWKIVSFVRHLPELSDEEQKALKAGAEEAGHHEGEPGEKTDANREETSAKKGSEDEHKH
jgi:mono/diheme cytochrome c family protein